MDIKLPFGLRDGVLINISEAQRGIACGCICPGCGVPLVARQGPILVHHFAHSTGEECARAAETALHLASKQILAKHREITLPAVLVEFEYGRDPIPISPVRRFALSNIRAELRTEDIVPDILADSDGHSLMIEIRVTHEVDEAKRAKIRELGISTVEIDLSAASRTFSHDELFAAVIRETANKKWIFNAKAEQYKRMLLRIGDRKKLITRGLALHADHCPISARVWKGKPYANFIDDCANCPFLLDIMGINDAIICGGRHKITTLDGLRALYRSRSG